MSWTDKKALEQINKLRDEFDVKLFIETGTFHGVNAAVQANNFKSVITCEVNLKYYQEAWVRLHKYPNVIQICQDSAHFLHTLTYFVDPLQPWIFFLDAHFYDPELAPEDRWVVLKELKALKGVKNCIIIIHDFQCNGLGHLNYAGQSLNLDLVLPALSEINPDFHFYGNTYETCDILTSDRVAAGEVANLSLDADVVNNLTYAWSKPEKTYRGLLYCTPKALDLAKFDLVSL
jgi:hypothetical protein